eukprot:scaffold1624_cov16-Tisochrysis_lutea.AAC.1
MDCGTHHYQRLMNEFGIVVDVFLSLDPASQDVIADITKGMGDGMAKFIEKEVKKTSEYDLYCHYVAGLVGIGLSQLFENGVRACDQVTRPASEKKRARKCFPTCSTDAAFVAVRRLMSVPVGSSGRACLAPT